MTSQDTMCVPVATCFEDVCTLLFVIYILCIFSIRSQLCAALLFTACHILECSEGLAQEVISTIGQAFELRFKQYLKNPPKLVTPHDR